MARRQSSGPVSPVIIAERYIGTVTTQRLELLAVQTRAEVAALRAEGVDIAYLGSIAIPHEETCFCLFAAESTIAVDAINRHVAIPCLQVVAALHLVNELIPPAR